MKKQRKPKFDNKNVKINREDLSITKIDEIDSTEQNPIFVVGIFVVLLIFILFLPSIVNLINKDEEKIDYSVPTNQTDDNVIPDANEITYYDYSSSLTAILEENITATDFKIDGTKLTFTINNNTNARYNFSNNHYYVELYTEDKTLLERVMIPKTTVGTKTSQEFTFNLDSNTISKFKKIVFVKKEETDYPNITLTANDSGKYLLTCSKDTEVLTYEFTNLKLISIIDELNIKSSTDNYETLKSNWESTCEEYQTYNGVEADFMAVSTEFAVKIEIDSKTADIKKLNNSYYYDYETLAKVISFEMNAQGFTCK